MPSVAPQTRNIVLLFCSEAISSKRSKPITTATKTRLEINSAITEGSSLLGLFHLILIYNFIMLLSKYRSNFP
jgi:hypothetical protein